MRVCGWIAAILVPGMLAGLVLFDHTATAADVTDLRALAPFTALQVDGRFMLHVVAAPTQSVTLSGDRYLINNLQVGVVGGVLTIDRPHGFDLPKTETVTITITVPSLTAVSLRGLVHASFSGLAGAQFSLTNNGAAAATLSGAVGRFKLVSRGVSSIDASALHAKDVTLMVRGQGTLRVFASARAKVTMYGEGTIDVFGHPPVHQFKTLAYGIINLK